MKKVALTLASFVLGTSLFAEGLSVSGYLRGGFTDTTAAPKYTTDTWLDGDYFGGSSRIRVNIDYEKDFGGVTFRYQDTGMSDFFDESTVAYAMAYANFLDGKIIAEGGVLTDRFTSSAGWEDTSFDGGKGVRLVVAPVEGLYLTAQAADNFAETYANTDKEVIEGDAETGDIKFNEKLLAFTAKYGNDDFFVTGGAAVAKKFYGSLGYTGVKGLTLVAEGIYDSTDATKAYYDDNALTTIVLWAEYTGVENLTLGIDSYINLTKDDNDDSLTFVTINPAVSYNFTKVISAALDATVNISSDDDVDTYATITPSLTFNASEKASATLYGTISTDTDQASHRIGAGVKYAF